MPAGRAPWVGGPTTDIRRAICGAVSKRSMPLSHAAALAGVHPRTAQRWLEQGGKDIEEGRPGTDHAIFAMSIACARARKTRRLLKDIENYAGIANAITGQKDPKSLQWLLERTEPEFRAKSEVEVDATVRTEDPRERLSRILGPLAAPDAAGGVDPEPQP